MADAGRHRLGLAGSRITEIERGRVAMREAEVGREDFALEPVPPEHRRVRVRGLFSIILGIPTALVFLATGGTLAATYGTRTLCVGLAVATVVVSIAGYILTSFAVRSGLDSDLMSIRAGFGLLGSGITSLIYSGTFVVLFALEDEIIANALREQYPEIPRQISLTIVGVLLAAITWYGVSGLAVLMNVTLPVFAAYLAWATINGAPFVNPGSFWEYPHSGESSLAVTFSGVLATVGVLMVFFLNATVAADVGRFLPESKRRVGAVMLGVALQLVSFFGAVLLGAWLTYRLQAGADPGRYLVRFLGFWGLLYVVVSQVRINVINLYAGSLSLSNFFARVLNFRPGRHIWVLTMASIGTTFAMTGIYTKLLGVLAFAGTFVSAWVMTLISYILRHRLLYGQLSNGDDPLKGKRIDWEGTTALIVALVVALPLAFGAAGNVGVSIAPILSGVIAALAVPVMCFVIHGRAGARPDRHICPPRVEIDSTE